MAGDGILVGTYRPENRAWITDRLLYNLPMTDNAQLAMYERFSKLILFDGDEVPLAFTIVGATVADRTQLKRLGYTLPSRAHGKCYVLFELGKVVSPESILNETLSELFVCTSRWSGVVDESFYSTPLPACEGQSTKNIFLKLKPYFVRKSAQAISYHQSDFMDILESDAKVPFPGPSKKDAKFTFIDLFAGIGGFRLAMQSCGGRCVFSSEFDAPAQKTYAANYGEVPAGDITKQETKDLIPRRFDIVCAGFPCQAFSLAGRRMGFDDNFKGLCRGTLFREVVEICEVHRPKAVFCENVKGLLIHDKGRTLQVIKGAFEQIGYSFDYYVLNSRDFGVPQNRERVYMVAFRNDLVRKFRRSNQNWKFPFKEIEEKHKGKYKVCLEDILEKNVSARYYLSDVYMETLRRHKKRHQDAGHGFGYEIRDRNGIAGAIVCGGMGRERNLVQEPDKKTPKGLVPETHIKGHINQEGIRKMTPYEWGKLQGFPMDPDNSGNKFQLVLSEVHLYKQFGNSVSVPVIKAISSKIVDLIQSLK